MPGNYNYLNLNPSTSPKNILEKIIDEQSEDSSIEEGMFVVEKLKNKRIRMVKKKPVEEYSVKWKGYPDSENTWETKKHLMQFIPEMVQE